MIFKKTRLKRRVFHALKYACSPQSFGIHGLIKNNNDLL